MRRILPDRVLFWGGPAHNEVYFVDKYVIEVAVPRLTYVIASEEPSMAPMFETVRYNAQIFAWFWEKELREAVVMIPGDANDSAAIIEIESVMEFLSTLWKVEGK